MPITACAHRVVAHEVSFGTDPVDNSIDSLHRNEWACVNYDICV